MSLWGLISPICKVYVNYRPVKVLPSVVPSARNCRLSDIDWVFIRENSEGEYAGQGGVTHEGQPNAKATDVSIYTAQGVECIMRFAFDTAASRPRKLLTMVTQSNAQRHGLVSWDGNFKRMAAEYTSVKANQMIVDAMTVRMVHRPASLDTIVATNLHSDILTISQLRFQEASELHRLATLIQPAIAFLCLSQFTAVLRASPGWVSRTLLVHSAVQWRCSDG
ncbi:hypothetical protein LTR37_006457 [Vermiconidia calcicola]|uniref:Uncharacterized protein n=1 Tax=Vermiconidia calcicola TaxID=1690605 RepID=A0ACC3NHB2_9PEZI|nr:hypothetical protein LTR37_006457 [Vermiconidia calcicola]